VWDKLFGSVNLMSRGLDASWLRNEVIRHNIANVETPGFKSSDVVFEETFAHILHGETEGGSDNMKRTREKHNLPSRREEGLDAPYIVENDVRSMRMDGNNVDIEDENAKLAKNSIQYNTILAKLNSELRRLSMAINEGR